MAWVPITVKEYHLFFGKFVNVTARPKDVEHKDWSLGWQKFEIVDQHGRIEAVEWAMVRKESGHWLNEPKLKYDFKHPRGYFRFDKNLIETTREVKQIEVLPPKPQESPRLSIQDKYNPKGRFFEVLEQIKKDSLNAFGIHHGKESDDET